MDVDSKTLKRNQKKTLEVKEPSRDLDVKDLLMIEAGSAIHFHGFQQQKKLLFVENAYRFWPNITRLCASVSISPSIYYQHVKLHPDFAKFMKAVDAAVTDDVEMVLRHEATNPKSFLDRMAYLRAHRPELYDRAKVVQVIGGGQMSGKDAQARVTAAELAVDAEIVKAGLSKQDRKALRQGRLEVGDGKQGESLGGGEK